MPEEFTLRVCRTVELDDRRRNAIIQVCFDAHEEPDFLNLFAYLPPDGLHIMGLSGESLVSHAVVITRWMEPEGQALLKTAWVDAVATDVQGCGYGSAVMQHLAAAIQADYQIAELQTDKIQFYARLGWEEWQRALAGRKEDGELVPTPDQTGIMILRLPGTPPLNLDGSLTIQIDGRIW